MKNIEAVNQSPINMGRINPELNKYESMPLFQEQIDVANEIMRRVGVPDLYVKTQEEEAFLLRVNKTVEQIKRYDRAIKHAAICNAPAKLIEEKQTAKAQFVAELIALMAKMDVNLEVKQAVQV